MTLLLLQMTTVLLVARLCGWISRKLGQSRVIGELLGGILIGPSVFGRFAPHAPHTLFPASSLGSFEVLRTIGLILFPFLIGSELDYEHLRRQSRTAVFASGVSIFFPFVISLTTLGFFPYSVHHVSGHGLGDHYDYHSDSESDRSRGPW